MLGLRSIALLKLWGAKPLLGLHSVACQDPGKKFEAPAAPLINSVQLILSGAQLLQKSIQKPNSQV
jgi:hypothetical protein